MAAGAAELYTGQLAQIRALSGPGAQQLAADLEYFCNVLAALSVALPADLVTWQVRRVYGLQRDTLACLASETLCQHMSTRSCPCASSKLACSTKLPGKA